jgi:hypothetical protein
MTAFLSAVQSEGSMFHPETNREKKLSPSASQRDSQSKHTSFRTRGVTGFLEPNEHSVEHPEVYTSLGR